MFKKYTCLALGLLLLACEQQKNNINNYTPVKDVQVIQEDNTGIRLGSRNAPIQIVAYTSLTCKHCCNFYLNSLPKIEKQYINTGKVSLLLKQFVDDKGSLDGSVLCNCLLDDEKYMIFIKNLYERQDKWLKSKDPHMYLRKYTQFYGFSDDEIDECLNNRELQGQLLSNQKNLISAYDIKAVPLFIINGRVYKNVLTFNSLDTIIQSELRQSMKKNVKLQHERRKLQKKVVKRKKVVIPDYDY